MGINFTYGIFHVVEALHEAGIPSTDPAIQRAAVWLLGKQRPDGGFGEHYSSCLTGEYVAHSESQVVNTSWALLTLLLALPPSHEATSADSIFCARCRAKTVASRSKRKRVFFGTAMLDYRLWSYFPLWALSRAARLGQELRHARTSHPLTR